MKTNDWTATERQLIKTRRKMFRDFKKFRRYYFPHYHKVAAAPFHSEVIEMLSRIAVARGSKIALAAPRGSAKSTIITLEYLIYSICYHTEDFIVIVSSTADHAAEALLNLKRELESNERLKKDFTDVCELDKKPGPARWSQHEIITKNNIKVTALGVGQNIRGKRHGESRPSLVILDDIEGNDMVQNEDSRYKLKDWFEKSVLKVGDGRTNFVFAGTIHHYGSLLAQYTDPLQTPGWESRIYRSIFNWSDATSEWQVWENIYRGNQEFNGQSGPAPARAYFEGNADKMLAGTEVLWPGNKSYYDLMVMREQEGSLSFDSEMQNEPINSRDCLFNTDDFHYWDEKYPDEAALIKSIGSPQFYAACDPSLGKSKTHGDFSAIIVGVYDSPQQILYVLDVDMERRQPENLMETILGYVKCRKIQGVIFESNGFQQMLVDELRNRASQHQLSLNLTPVENHGDKLSRIQALEPFLKTGKIQFSRKHRALIEQLKYFPKGMHDDGPDALEMLFQGLPKDVDWAQMNKGLTQLAAGLERDSFERRWRCY